jgi:ribonucleoside-diphosphate reductase alpha chain
MKKLAEGVHLKDIEGVPEEYKQYFVTAHEITPEWHIRMQAAFQNSTDNAVSKTVNFPKEATKEDVSKVYLMAYEAGLKGITIYRDGSREGQVLTTGKEKKPEPVAAQPAVVSRTPRPRAKVTTGITEKVTTGCGNVYITVNSDDHGICEVFTHLGKAGGCAVAQLEATCRLISLALRAGVDVDSVVKQLRGIRCPSIAWENGKSVLSCADAIASVLEKISHPAKSKGNVNGHGHDTNEKSGVQDFGLVKNTAGQCPECSNLLVYQEGCFVCPGCGYTKC